MRDISVLGIDLAKDVFQLHGIDMTGKAVLKKKLSRSQLKEFVVNLKPCTIAIEACGGSHYWAREFQNMGHVVRVISPQFVKPYVKTNKNDAADAEAITEAVTRPNMRFVPIKQKEQQDVQAIHRIRERLIRNRTSLHNELRGLLHEYGVIAPKLNEKLRQKAYAAISSSDDNRLTQKSRQIFGELLLEIVELEKRIEFYEKEIKQICKNSEKAQSLTEIEGVGPITATAVLAAVGDPNVFKNGRHFSAWLGLVPKQYSSGGKEKPLGISKRGDSYIRYLLVHGTRAALRFAALKSDRKSRWATEKAKTIGTHKACVALANKNARIIWAMLAKGEKYRVAA